MAILLISGVIMPPFIIWLIHHHIIDQWKDIYGDGNLVMVQTKAEAQKDIRDMLRSNPLTYIWMLFACVMIGAACISINLFGAGDWFYSN